VRAFSHDGRAAQTKTEKERRMMGKQTRDPRMSLLAAAFAVLLAVVCFGADTVSVQGLLKGSDGVPLASGTYDMQFSLYTVASGGTAEWTETHDGANAVTVTAGMYAVELGGITAFPATLFSANPDLWLEVAVDMDGDATYEEVFAPRMKLASAPYAHEAKNAKALQGQAASAFAAATHTHDGADIVAGTVVEARIDGAIARDAEVATAISTHAGVANAHHAWPLTDVEVPDNISVSSAGSVDGGALKSGIVAAARIDPAITRDSELALALMGRPQFDAVIAPILGDYPSIQAALAAGKKTIFVRKGTYTLGSDINIITSGTVIIGESRDGVIIDCNNTAYGIKAYGDSANYGDGTISITNGTSVVTGSGTLWLANAAGGEYVQLRGDWHKIQSVDSNTQLTLAKNYYGRSLSAEDYKIAAMLANIRLENLTVQNYNQSSSGGIDFQWVMNSVIRNCAANNSHHFGISLKETSRCALNKNVVHDNNENGIYVKDSWHDAVCENFSYNNGNMGIVLSSSSNSCVIGSFCTSNDASGIYVYSSSDNSINGNCCENNNNYGIELTLSTNNVVSANSCAKNNNDGISLTATADNNTLTENSCKNNGGSGIILSGDDNTLNGNTCQGNAEHGIRLGGCEDNSVSGNICADNTQDGIRLTGTSDHNTIGLNSASSNGGYGINIDSSGSDYDIVTGNQLNSNTIKANKYPAF
jgi:parallel beta-helix repeat protein